MTVIITYLAYKVLPGRLSLGSCAIVTMGFLIGVMLGGGSAKVSRCARFRGSSLLAAVNLTRRFVPLTIALTCFLLSFFLPFLSLRSLGVMFGVLSSITTACHAIVIKASLPAVDGSTMALAWYSNTLSAIVMLPLSFICAEGAEIARTWGDVELLKRFLWGSAVTVSAPLLLLLALLARACRRPGFLGQKSLLTVRMICCIL